MKKWIIILICFYINIEAQIDIQYLNDVPESFKEKYYSQPREYNPLHVGDVWQYTGEGYYTSENIINDTLVNGIKYYKRIIDYNEKIVSWERSDSAGNSFILDFEDVDEDGNYDEELPIDSLELPRYSRYKTYKGSYKYFFPPKEGLTALIYDTLWVVFVNDTVLAKNVQYDYCFCSVIICDKYGTILSMGDAPPNILTGAIINGRKYGTIVDVDETGISLPNETILENNYPNPFNPSTNIEYRIQKTEYISLKVYDVLGRKVETLVNKEQPPGNYKVQFNGDDLNSGVYFIRMETSKYTNTIKALLIK